MIVIFIADLSQVVCNVKNNCIRIDKYEQNDSWLELFSIKNIFDSNSVELITYSPFVSNQL